MTGKLVEQQRRESAERFGELDDGTRARWTGGAVRRVGVRHVVVGERLCGAVGVHAGERVLDVAAGSGNAALAAARRGASVTASDIAEAPLELARRRAELEGLALTTELADAAELPFEDASFDVVLSTFGVMFAPDQQRVADELTRICRPGGRIGLASWTPRGLVGSSFATIDEHLPPSRAVKLASALEWGTVSHLQAPARRPRRRAAHPAALHRCVCGISRGSPQLTQRNVRGHTWLLRPT